VGMGMTDAEIIALIPEWQSEYKGRSPSSFRRWLRSKGYNVGTGRLERILRGAGSSTQLVPKRLRKWEALGKDGEVVELSHITYDIAVDWRSAIGEFVKQEVVPIELGSVKPKGDLVGVISVPDIHIGKLAWANEVGDNYDSKIAERIYLSAVADLLQSMVSGGVGKIIYIVGNDLLHVDGFNNTTTAGTPQDTDTRWQYAFRRAKRMIVSTIVEMSKHASVHVVISPGNHDRLLSWTLGEVIAASFEGADHITVDNSPKYRKYVKVGKLLFGITHGDGIKNNMLPTLMATEVPELWGESKWREWYLGHYHRKQHLSTVGVEDQNGVRVHYLPSLAGVDRWHYERGYSAIRSAEAHLYDPDAGKLVASYYTYPED